MISCTFRLSLALTRDTAAASLLRGPISSSIVPSAVIRVIDAVANGESLLSQESWARYDDVDDEDDMIGRAGEGAAVA